MIKLTPSFSYSFRFEPNDCNRCHDILIMSVNLSDIDILNIKDSDYCHIISLFSVNKAIGLMQNAGLTENKTWKLKNI